MLFDIGVTLKGKKSLPFLLTTFSAIMTLMLQSDLPAIRQKQKVQQQCSSSACTLFLICTSFHFPFLPASCWPSSLLSTLLFSFLPSLPFFLYSTNICEIPRVCVHDKGTIKEVSREQIHQLEFTENRWSPSKEFKCTACFSFG